MTRVGNGLVITVIAIAAAVWRLSAPAPLPSFAEVRAAYAPSDARLLDRSGALLHELRVDTSRRRLDWTSLDAVSPALQVAMITSEDRRFYRHGGVDAAAAVAAAASRLAGGPRRGASTITMQVASLIDPSLRRSGGPRTWRQKWRQMRDAWALEGAWSKSEVLEAYLNLVTFRGELQGAAAAAHVLFGKQPHGLTESEAAVLAALVRAPNAAPSLVTQRATRLRATSPRANDLTEAVDRALAALPGTGPRVAQAPHVARLLLRAASPIVPVRSTLDLGAQRIASEVLRRHLLALRERNVHDGAVLVLDNATGDALAYVGSSADLSPAPQVDGVRAHRQAGSALKPFLYGLAFDRRLLTAASLIEDAPLELPVAGGLYRPQNYDEQFRGLVTARTALAGSLNVPAVRVLGLVGADAVVQQLQRLGFESVNRPGEYYGPALALGSADVSLWELTNAYRAVANGGVWSPARLAAEESPVEERRVYSAAAAFVVSSILADRESRSVTFGLDSPLVTSVWTAVKTGTSKDMRDNWCVGYSRRFTVGVWVGNFSGAAMHDVSGVTGAAPVWVEMMQWLHRGVPSSDPAAPEGVDSTLVGAAGGAVRREWFISGTEPLAASSQPAPWPRIVAPVADTIIALDPDIPAALQRVPLRAETAGARAHWVLDGEPIGSAAVPLLWPPVRGRHALALVDDAERTVDRVVFTVRGGARN